MQVDKVQRLTSGQLSEVLALVDAATLEDTVSPLSEQVLLAARGEVATVSAPHLLAYDGTHLAGYAHLERGSAGEVATAEVVVDPGHRRHGVGTMLIQALEDALTSDPHRDQDGTDEPQGAALAADGVKLQLWAHGHLEGARGFALRDGYSTVRELWQMRRPLPSSGSLPDVSLPDGFTTRHFVVGQDEDAWLRVNARAFIHHPEQGRMTRADLDRRIAEPWFDAQGFILIEDIRRSVPVLAASHWTKVVPVADPQVRPTEGELSVVDDTPVRPREGELSAVGDDPPVSTTEGEGQVVGDDATVRPTTGEVYVVGVDPAYQGLGLGRAATILGLGYLRERGLAEATLYVEADNRAAVATYSRLGFTRCGVDTMYSRTVHSPV